MANNFLEDFIDKEATVTKQELESQKAQLKTFIGKQYFNGQDVKVYVCNKTDQFKLRLEEVAYVQIAPVQNIQPVYNVFEDKPSMFIYGHKMIQGTIGFNMQFAENLQQIAEISNSNNIGQQKLFEQEYGTGLYVERLKIVFQKNLSIQWFYPVIDLDDVYIFGGQVQQAPDQTPIQDIYYFVQLSLKRNDKIELD